MPEFKVMMLEDGTDQRMCIRCRLISEWYMIYSYISNKEMLLLEIMIILGLHVSVQNTISPMSLIYVVVYFMIVILSKMN